MESIAWHIRLVQTKVGISNMQETRVTEFLAVRNDTEEVEESFAAEREANLIDWRYVLEDVAEKKFRRQRNADSLVLLRWHTRATSVSL